MKKYKLALAVISLPLLAHAATGGEILHVNNYQDDGSEGTLRWAIEKNNQNPGSHTIAIDAVGKAPYVITVKSPLPPVKGPVTIAGSDWSRNGTYVAIDGAGYIGQEPHACPGAVAGQFGANVRTTTSPGLVLRDTQGVDISGVEIRNFCIGVLINRASGNVIHDNRIVGNHGGAGIMITGDDGKGNSTATTTVHNKILRNEFINNGDAMEMTRGAAFNLIADNRVTTDASNEEPSQGIEILWGNDNFVVRNHFSGYSDGVQLNWGNRNYIAANTFTGISSAVTLSGTGNIVDGNIMTGNRVAVSVRPQGSPNADGTPGINRISGPALNRITGNSMWNNGKDIKRCFAGGACLPQHKGAIVFGVPGLEHAVFSGNRGGGVESDPAKLEKICADGVTGNCEPMPNHNQPAPQLLSARRAGDEVRVSGRFTGQANTLSRIELFANSDRRSDEAEQYLGFVSAPVDGNGNGNFSFVVDGRHVANFTATVTTVDGATSMLSKPLALGK